MSSRRNVVLADEGKMTSITVNEGKLKGILEYCLVHGARNGVPKTKLLKLIYLADFSAYFYTGQSITGAIYKNRTYGPVPDPLFVMIDEMKEVGDILVEPGEQAQFHKLKVEPKAIASLKDSEVKLLDKICNYWYSKSTQEIVSFTHLQRPWALTRADEVIPYDLILQEEHPYVPQSLA